MAKNKSVSIGEYILQIDENKSVTVYRIYKSTIAGLKECAASMNFEVKDTWFAQALGRNLLKEFCNGEKSGTIGEFYIERDEKGHIDAYRKYSNSIDALREISDAIGFPYEKKWNTQTFGAKLLEYAEVHGPFKIKKAKKEVETVAQEAKTVTVTLWGRAELYRADAVREDCTIDKDDFDSDQPYNYYAEQEQTNDNPIEFALIYKNPGLKVEVDGQDDIKMEGSDEVDRYSVETNWFGPRYTAFGHQVVVSIMKDMFFAEQKFKIELKPGEAFDINKLKLINVTDDSLIGRFAPEGYLLCDYIVYDGKVVKAETEAFEGGKMNFRGSVLASGVDTNPNWTFEYEDGYVDSSKMVMASDDSSEAYVVDEDSDSEELDLTEIGERVKRIDLSKFSKLKVLSCYELNIQTLDLSHNPELEELDCSCCEKLTELDLSHNPKLKTLNICGATALKKIDVSGVQGLEELDISDCEAMETVVMKDAVIETLTLDSEQAVAIDFSQPKCVKELRDWRKNNETTLDLSALRGLKELQVDRHEVGTVILPTDNQLTLISLGCALVDVDLTNCPNLEEALLTNSPNLRSINVTGLANLTRLEAVDCEQLEKLVLGGNDSLKTIDINLKAYSGFDFSQIANIKDVTIHSYPGTKLVFADMPNVQSFSLEECEVESVEISQCNSLEDISIGECDSLKDVSVANSPNLEKISVTNNQNIQAINVTGATALEDLYVDGCGLDDLDACSIPAQIKTLTLYGYKGSSLDLSKFPSLTTLTIADASNIATLDLSPLTDLETLDLEGSSSIESVDLSNCTKLKTVYANSTSFSSLDLKALSELEVLSCNYCSNLTEVDITANPKVSALYMEDTEARLIMKEGHVIEGINGEDGRDSYNISDDNEIVYVD